jgi:hypothetical protein
VSRAWKFLDDRGKGVFSGFPWPTPGADGGVGPWVEARRAVACEEGVHACSLDQLAWWMSAQLWEIELDNPVDIRGQKVVATRGRLTRRIDEWPHLGGPLAEWGVWRVRDHAVALLESIEEPEHAAVAQELAALSTVEALAGCAARAGLDPTTAAGIAVSQAADAAEDIANPIVACWDAARAAGHRASAVDRSITSYQAGFAVERQIQSRWIAQQLRLTTDD